MLGTQDRTRFGAILSVSVLLAVALFLGALSAWAPALAIFLIVLVSFITILLGAFKWAKVLASKDRSHTIYLLLFWVWIVNVPALVAFDPRGIVRLDLFNPQSLTRIGLFFLIGIVFVVNWIAEFRATSHPSSTVRLLLLPFFIFGWYAIDAFLVLDGQDLLLALYRVAEWILLLHLIAAVVERAPRIREDLEPWLLRVPFALLLFYLVITVVILPLAPSRAYFVGASGVGRLGNPFAHPNVLGILAGLAFFYFLEHRPKLAILGEVFALATMLATFSRGAWVGFSLALIVYVLLKSRTLVLRVFVSFLFVFAVIVGWAMQDFYLDELKKLLARGGPETALTTASERTEVWHASQILIKRAPILGHGFVSGPKKLNEVMASGPTGSYFRAPHAHNEFVQTQVNGGMLASLLLAIFLLRNFYLVWALRAKVSSAFLRCVMAWLLMIWTFGMLTPNVSGQVQVLGGLLMYLYVALEFLYQRSRAQGRATGRISTGQFDVKTGTGSLA